MRQCHEKKTHIATMLNNTVFYCYAYTKTAGGNQPIEEPPNEPHAPPVIEPGEAPDKPTDPNKPPVEEPWNDPPPPPLKEPPHESPNKPPPKPHSTSRDGRNEMLPKRVM